MSRWWKLPEELGSGVFRETGRFQGLIDLRVPGHLARLPVPQGWLTEVKEPAPAEPGERAVVVDRDGDAWQRRANAWHLARHDGCSPRDWAFLHEHFGPLKVVYEGEG
jgi:hypothetical protein